MPAWIHDRAEHLLAKNPSMPKSMAFAVATQQGHALGKSPKGYGTMKGRHEAKAKFDTPKDDVKKANPGSLSSSKMEKKADISELLPTSLPTIAGLVAGYAPARRLAGETAAAAAPQGRVTRSDSLSRDLAMVGAPAAGFAALALSHKLRAAPKITSALLKKYPGGLVADPEIQAELIRLGTPLATGAIGSIAGGLGTGAGVGLIQRLRGSPKGWADRAPDKTDTPTTPETIGAKTASAFGLELRRIIKLSCQE